MALFTLTDIKFPKIPSVFVDTGLVGKKYESNIYRYPIDIGDVDKGHYMVIHINQQDRTQFKRPESGDVPTIFENFKTNGVQNNGYAVTQTAKLLQDLLKQNAGKLDWANGDLQGKINYELTKIGVPSNVTTTTINFFESLGRSGGTQIKSAIDQLATGKFLRTITRTTDTVALYMPDTLAFTHQQSYSSLSLGGGLFAGAGEIARLAKNASEAIASGQDAASVIGSTIGNASPFIASRLAKQFFGDAGVATFAAATGVVENPQLELIYTSPAFREFRFEFMLYPRSQQEAQEVQNILERLRFHQAPEIAGTSSSAGGFGSYFLIPPSEFDIKFYYNGKENPNISPISTCVLRSIDIDYAPGGFSAYEVPGKITPELGSTGMPVGIRLSLDFMETEILTKANYYKDRSGRQ